ncbi:MULTISPECIES: hypothetical protein [unclassified Lysinibacillus]|uniref:hypothetical protein n=1 Tax=unclassified Lysinibacillus TaxID=2636778 RepID=UPI00380EE60E
MTTIDIERIKEDSKRLREAKEREDKERGYCVIPKDRYAPVVSDQWVLEVYHRHWDEIKKFMAEYASVLLVAKGIRALGEDAKLTEWLDILSVAKFCRDKHLRLHFSIIAQVFIPTVISGQRHSGTNYATLAQLIANVFSRYPPSIQYDSNDDYDGDFEGYYATKREEVLEWKQTYCIEN